MTPTQTISLPKTMKPRDDWLTYAMSDDRMVADLLLRLNPSSSSAPPFNNTSYLTPLRWSFRQTRSRMTFRCYISPEKKLDLARNSPTTPLPWSTGGGAASSSGTADGYDESTLPVCRFSESRSKFVITDSPATADANKCKKKKIFPELKDEEVSLLKERVHLKKEIAILRTTFKEHSATNKNEENEGDHLDFDLNSTNGATIAAEEKDETASAFDLIYRTYPTSQNASNFCQASIPVEELDGGFLLPDLNMAPYEDDFSSDGLHGVSCAEGIQVTGC